MTITTRAASLHHPRLARDGGRRARRRRRPGGAVLGLHPADERLRGLLLRRQPGAADRRGRRQRALRRRGTGSRSPTRRSPRCSSPPSPPLGLGAGSLIFITTALLGAAVVSAWLTRHYFGLGRWRDAVADWRFRAVALAGTAAILLLGPWRDTFDFGQINIILMGLILADFALHGKVPGRGDPLAGRAADRDRGRHQADPARVRPVLPGPPRLQGPRLDGRRLLRLDRLRLGPAAHGLGDVLDQDPAGHRTDRRPGLRGQPLRQGAAAAPGPAGLRPDRPWCGWCSRWPSPPWPRW